MLQGMSHGKARGCSSPQTPQVSRRQTSVCQIICLRHGQTHCITAQEHGTSFFRCLATSKTWKWIGYQLPCRVIDPFHLYVFQHHAAPLSRSTCMCLNVARTRAAAFIPTWGGGIPEDEHVTFAARVLSSLFERRPKTVPSKQGSTEPSLDRTRSPMDFRRPSGCLSHNQHARSTLRRVRAQDKQTQQLDLCYRPR